MSFIPGVFYIFATLLLDKQDKEPQDFIFITFVWGLVIPFIVALPMNAALTNILSSFISWDYNAILVSISAPIIEEIVKGSFVFYLFFFQKKNFNGMEDGLIYSCIVGFGFAVSENVYYYSLAMSQASTHEVVFQFFSRGIVSSFAHPLFTSMTGIGLGMAIYFFNKWVRIFAPIVGFILAVSLHSIWNSAGHIIKNGFFISIVFLFIPIMLVLVVLVLLGLLKNRKHNEKY